MASGHNQQEHARDPPEPFETTTAAPAPTTLLDLLSNTLVLEQTIPYLPLFARLNLATTSQSFRALLRHTPGVFRHIDLTRVKTAQFDIDGIDHGGQVWRNVQLDENVTEDDFYSGPLRGIVYNLRRQNILQDVQTLVLDGLSVTAEFCNDILTGSSFRVRILSLREVKNLNERKLMQSLRYACRTTRPDGTPRVQALYMFGKKDAPTVPPTVSHARGHVTARGTNIGVGWNHKSQNALKESIENEAHDWYHRRGRVITKHITDGWAEALLDCRETIKFDAVLCTGPRHQNSPSFGKIPVSSREPHASTSPWGIATFALGGCALCGSAPEGFTVYGDSPSETLPLLSPVPLHSSNVKRAMRPDPLHAGDTTKSGFVPRCLECIRERYCFSCDQWWCESCYEVPGRDQMVSAQHVHVVDEVNGMMDHEIIAIDQQPKTKTRRISRSCWECEHNCLDCIANTQKMCKGCGGGYCIIHYEGSTLTLVSCSSLRTVRAYLKLTRYTSVTGALDGAVAEDGLYTDPQ